MDPTHLSAQLPSPTPARLAAARLLPSLNENWVRDSSPFFARAGAAARARKRLAHDTRQTTLMPSNAMNKSPEDAVKKMRAGELGARDGHPIPSRSGGTDPRFIGRCERRRRHLDYGVASGLVMARTRLQESSTGATRSRFRPQVPAMAELGHATSSVWFGLMIRAGTAGRGDEFSERGQGGTCRSGREGKTRNAGFDVSGQTGPEFAAQIERWARLSRPRASRRVCMVRAILLKKSVC
jgi:hypothetical protein